MTLISHSSSNSSSENFSYMEATADIHSDRQIREVEFRNESEILNGKKRHLWGGGGIKERVVLRLDAYTYSVECYCNVYIHC
jgi:hypothetical protein